MVSGAVIANTIFFEISPPAEDGAFSLRALPQHEVWLQSTPARLQDLVGALRFVEAPDQNAQSVGSLIRTDSGYRLELYAAAAINHPRTLIAVFDGEYQQSYESPGGYSDAYGIRYWDDVACPIAALSRFEIQ